MKLGQLIHWLISLEFVLQLNYLKPKKVFCNEPTLGRGFVQTEHGKLSIPSPAVIELLRKKDIKVIFKY